MNYGRINLTDVANGPGIRVSLFVSGCRNHCKGCFQPETWDFNYGKEFTYDILINIQKSMEPEYISGLSILGGEPLDDNNIEGVSYLVKRFREKFGNSKTIWIWSGYTFEELIQHKEKKEILDKIFNKV